MISLESTSRYTSRYTSRNNKPIHKIRSIKTFETLKKNFEKTLKRTNSWRNRKRIVEPVEVSELVEL